MKKSELKRVIVQLTKLLEIRDEEIRHLKDDFLMLRDDVAYHFKCNNELVEKLNELRGENVKLKSRVEELESEIKASVLPTLDGHVERMNYESFVDSVAKYCANVIRNQIAEDGLSVEVICKFAARYLAAVNEALLTNDFNITTVEEFNKVERNIAHRLVTLLEETDND